MNSYIEPTWSPHGWFIAYAYSPDNQRHFIGFREADVPNGQTVQLSDPNKPVSQPLWSPDGTLIAAHTIGIISSGGTTPPESLLVIGFDGTLEQTFDDFSGGFLTYSWAPDSRRLAVASTPMPPDTETASEQRQLFVVELGSGSSQQITAQLADNSTPAWRPDPTIERPVPQPWPGATPDVPVPNATATATPETGDISPNTAEQFRALVPGEERNFVMDIRTDARLDHGALRHWNVKGTEQLSWNATSLRFIIARHPDYTIHPDPVIVEYGSDGQMWWWESRGWLEHGDVSAGISEPPEEIRLATEALAMVDAILSAPERFDIVSDSVTAGSHYARYRTDIGNFARLYPFETTSAYIELQTATAPPQDVLSIRVVAIDSNGGEHVLSDVAFDEVVVMPIGEIWDMQTPDGVSGARQFQYAPPSNDTLPVGLRVERHTSQFPAAAELFTLISDAGLTIAVRILPSHGGYDAASDHWYWDGEQGQRLARTTESPVGLVTWVTDHTDSPVRAMWDDGRYAFRLEITNPPTLDVWNDAIMMELVETLSAVPPP